MDLLKTIIDKIKKYKWIYLLIFCIAFFSDDCFWAATSGNKILSTGRYIFVVFLPVFFLLFLNVRITKKLQSLLVLLSGCIFFASLLSGSGLGGPIMLFFSFLSTSFIVTKIGIKEFSDRYCEAVIALIIYSFVIQMLILINAVPIKMVDNVSDVSLSTFGGCVYHKTWYGGMFMRNGCFFREPGVFMVYICVAYIFDIWKSERGVSLQKQLIYLLGVFSTMSTAGIIIWGILFIMNGMRKKTLRIGSVVSMLIVFGLAYTLFTNEMVYSNVFDKIERGTDSGSVLGRISSIYIPLRMALASPLWGWGTEQFRETYMDYGQILFHARIDPQGLATNSILNASAIFGLWFGVWIIIGFFALSKKMSAGNTMGKMLTFICLLMIFSNESMQYSLIFYVLLFYGYYKVKWYYSVRKDYIVKR